MELLFEILVADLAEHEAIILELLAKPMVLITIVTVLGVV